VSRIYHFLNSESVSAFNTNRRAHQSHGSGDSADHITLDLYATFLLKPGALPVSDTV
jgi:hypothetical protein